MAGGDLTVDPVDAGSAEAAEVQRSLQALQVALRQPPPAASPRVVSS